MKYQKTYLKMSVSQISDLQTRIWTIHFSPDLIGMQRPYLLFERNFGEGKSLSIPVD